MKRSKINSLIEEAKALLHQNGIRLPPFAYWTPAEWKTKGAECDEIRRCGLGWDITDFGSGQFGKIGFAGTRAASARRITLFSSSELMPACLIFANRSS